MTDREYVDHIHHGHFLYWDMLGNLSGMKNHKGADLHWLTGGIKHNYFANTSDVNGTIKRMRSGEIPDNLMFLMCNLDDNPTKHFVSTGLFEDAHIKTGMAHTLTGNPISHTDKRISLFQVKEISHLKSAGAILNSVFDYRLFTLAHFVEILENDNQFLYLAEYDGLPAGACMSQHGDGFVNISWVGTLPGYRKLGIAGHLINLAEHDGVLNGKTVGVLNAFPEVIGTYRRVGYKEYCRYIILEFSESK